LSAGEAAINHQATQPLGIDGGDCYCCLLCTRAAKPKRALYRRHRLTVSQSISLYTDGHMLMLQTLCSIRTGLHKGHSACSLACIWPQSLLHCDCSIADAGGQLGSRRMTPDMWIRREVVTQHICIQTHTSYTCAFRCIQSSVKLSAWQDTVAHETTAV